MYIMRNKLVSISYLGRSQCFCMHVRVIMLEYNASYVTSIYLICCEFWVNSE